MATSVKKPAAKNTVVKKPLARKTSVAKTAGKAAERALPANQGEPSLTVMAPDYWDQACKELMKNDRILKKLIPKYGTGFLVTRGDPFTTLARA
ncbi:MAG: DNA-3-methyladenine glycosylase 2 family protein, partial [Polynucleobacter sp.]